MSLRINLNSAALTAHRNLSSTSSAAEKSIARLSSGYKINNASDDPAGLVISEKLRAQVSGLAQAISNAGDATNMVKTAEGALNEANTLLRSMRDLALHAANTGANDGAAVAADQEQIKSAIESLNNISAETQFGNKKLLDGSAGVSVKVYDSHIISADLSKTNLPKGSTSVNVTVNSPATQTTITGGVNLTTNPPAADGTIFINGVPVDYKAGDTEASIASKINAVEDKTGVKASISADGNHRLILTADEYGSTTTITTAQDSAIIGTPTSVVPGTNIDATITDSTGAAIGGTWNKGVGNVLQDNLGNTITFAVGTAAAALPAGAMSVESNYLEFQVGAYAGQMRTVAIGSTAANMLGSNAIAGQNLSTIDVTKDAQSAIKVLDAAITQVSSQRAALGAFQKNILESTINSLTVAKENIAASESTIRDTDMAAEMTEYTKENILQQAGVSMLAQANQAPQNLLKLLQ